MRNGSATRRASGRRPPEEIDWFEPAKKVFDPAMGVYGRWFAGGVLNTCYNALDRHVAGGRATQAALIYNSPVTGTQSSFSYAEMLFEVQALAAILQDFGVGKGDRVIIYMPLVPEAAFAMLACARIGAVHSVVFGGFAAKELAKRIDDAKPKVILRQAAASSRAASSNTSRCSTKRSRWRSSSRRPASCCSGRRSRHR